MADRGVFFPTLNDPDLAVPRVYDGPLSLESEGLMEEILKFDKAINYHYTAMNLAADKMAELQKQADIFRDKAAEHKAKLLDMENKLRGMMGELSAELTDDLANHQVTDPNPIVPMTLEDIGRQV